MRNNRTGNEISSLLAIKYLRIINRITLQAIIGCVMASNVRVENSQFGVLRLNNKTVPKINMQGVTRRVREVLSEIVNLVTSMKTKTSLMSESTASQRENKNNTEVQSHV